jgi:hypothetical protein
LTRTALLRSYNQKSFAWFAIHGTSNLFSMAKCLKTVCNIRACLPLFIALAMLLIPVRTVANDCDFPQDFRVLRVDRQNKRLFVEGNEADVSSQNRIDSYLRNLDRVIATCEPSWKANWSLSVFSNPKLAGYKSDGELSTAVENGNWGRAYVAEYDRSTQVLTILPVDSRKRRTRKVIINEKPIPR